MRSALIADGIPAALFGLMFAFIVGFGATPLASSQALPIPEPTPPSTDCGLIAEPGERIARVALGERVNPGNAPHPSNDSERLLFRQIYENLVRVDCNGRVGPGLAASWRLDAGAWILTLQESARFSDGTPVTTADVLSSWTLGGTGNELQPSVRRLVRSIVAVDDRTLAITLQNPRPDSLLALAHTDLAIAKRLPGSLWPVGTRAVTAANGDTALSMITLLRGSEASASSIQFVVAPGRDGRDLLDEGADLLLTRDTATLNYAATLRQFVAIPLAWQRTHVLLTPGRSRTAPLLSPEAREALAHDAVRGEARGAQGPFWWQASPDCQNTSTPSRDAASPGRVVYDAGDGIARDLAERLVGLASASGRGATAILDALLPDRPNRSFQRATGLNGQALTLARRRGNEAGYILSLDGHPLDSCRDLQVLMEDMGWIDAETIVPLVDTRAQALVRRGRSGVIAEGDGGLLLLDGGR